MKTIQMKVIQHNRRQVSGWTRYEDNDGMSVRARTEQRVNRTSSYPHKLSLMQERGAKQQERRAEIQRYEHDDGGMSVRTRTDQLLAQIITYARVVGLPVSERLANEGWRWRVPIFK